MKMDFVKALLEANEPWAVYEGIVFDRYLTITTQTGRKLRVFDLDLLSEELETGITYDFVLSTLDVPGSLKMISGEKSTAGILEKMWTGKVSAKSYVFEPNCCQKLSDQLLRREAYLVLTSIGEIVYWIHPDTPELQVDQWVTWESMRIDLQGIV